MTVQRKRLILLMAALTTWGIVVGARLAQIQIVRHDEYVERARRQQERTVTLTSLRGSVFDREGRLLAASETAMSVFADPKNVEDPAAAAKALAPLIGVDTATIENRLRRKSEFVWLARQVDDEVYERVASLDLQGIHFLEEHRRTYPNGATAAGLLGWVGIDGEGLAGVEHSLDEHVRGAPGVVTLLRDARRATYLVGGDVSPRNGLDLVLTIDEVIQYVTERALQRTVERFRAKSGSAVVIDPVSGAIYAMAAWPSFDPNRYQDYPQSSWRNRPVQDVYEPGSTFKIVAAAAGLEEGLVTPSQIIDCENGEIEIAGFRIREHGGHRFGLISFSDVIVKSSNVGMVKIASALGDARMYRYIRAFGFGEKTGVSLPGEETGIVRPPEKWSLLSRASMSFGQEIAVTPLQMVRAMAVIANGGLTIEPRIVERVVDAEGRTVWLPEVHDPERVVSERTAAVMNEILKMVVADGTGKNAGLDEYVVAGKTGTAQKAVRGGYSASKTIASFVGYVPADRPRLAILVLVDEPQGAQYGGDVAAPAFREIAEASLRYLEVEPATPRREMVVPLRPSTDLASLAPRSHRRVAR